MNGITFCNDSNRIAWTLNVGLNGPSVFLLASLLTFNKSRVKSPETSKLIMNTSFK